jgi:nitrile hydratase
MNGVHDMGGMHGMGPIQEETNEPVFHQPWEARVFALYLATGTWRKWTLDGARHERELIPPAEYLRMSYYERWLAGLVPLLAKSGMIMPGELEQAKPERTVSKAVPPLSAGQVPAVLAKGSPANRETSLSPRFRVGQQVRTRNMHPLHHTRLPRYVRAKLGTIARDHGAYVFPDTNAHGQGEKPQHVYSVRFTARELWGRQAAPQDSVYVDLWDDYLETA